MARSQQRQVLGVPLLERRLQRVAERAQLVYQFAGPFVNHREAIARHRRLDAVDRGLRDRHPLAAAAISSAGLIGGSNSGSCSTWPSMFMQWRILNSRSATVSQSVNSWSLGGTQNTRLGP